MDGSIERGYSGNSFFFENDEIIINERIVGLCQVDCFRRNKRNVINNVNVHGSGN